MSKYIGLLEVPARVQQEMLRVHGLHIERRIEGGLSAARLWRCSGDVEPACLRCWPPAHPSEQRLRLIHQALREASAAKLVFAPRILPLSSGETFLNCKGELWELTRWMPGAADYHQQPSIARLKNAVEALADIHAVWHQWMPSHGASRGIEKRIELLSYWISSPMAIQSIAEQPLNDDLATVVGETCRMLLACGPRLLEELLTIRNVSMTLHPILRDVWSDHILFTGDQVSGIIDYGALAIDTPAADLARMLGSLEPDDLALRQRGVELYHERRESSYPAWSLVDLLDRSGTVLAAVQWMEWLVVEKRTFSVNIDKLVDRWRGLLTRAKLLCGSAGVTRTSSIWIP